MDTGAENNALIFAAIFGGSCALFIGACVRGACLGYVKTDTAYAALHSPSVRNARNAFDRRVALAVREAKRGFEICSGCNFTNPKHTASCVLCGALIQREPASEPSRSHFWHKRAEARIVTSESNRQRRIKRRKEWVRRVDETGQVTWSQNQTRQHHSTMPPFPSYVLQSTGDPSPLRGSSTSDEHAASPPPSGTCLANEVAIDIEPRSSGDALEVQTVAPSTSIMDVAVELTNELNGLSVAAVAVTEADPSHLAFASIAARSTAPTTTHSTADSVHNSELDFPTKLAQFITSMASLFTSSSGGSDDSKSKLMLTRSSLLFDSIQAIATMTPAQARAGIRVEFVGEQGIDAGGVYREWFLLLNEQIVDPNAGIFTCVDPHDKAFHLNPHSREVLGENHLAHIFAAGRLLGRALLEGNVTGFHLALPLLKIILGLPVGFDDLEYFDPDVYKNLKWLLENDGADALCLNFTVVEKLPNGTTRVVELVPGGSEMDVNDANKHDFVDRKLKYLLFESVSSQLFAFLKGLYEVVPAELLMLFDAEELDYVLSGSDEIDVDDWEAHTVISKNLGGYPAHDKFWKVVRELSIDDRRRLLQFATGSARVPPGGFGALTSNDGRLCLFSLRGVRVKSTHGHLHSHACFNRLDLPMHSTTKSMRAAVHAAISVESMGFTTD